MTASEIERIKDFAMTLEEIKGEIRSLKSEERIEIYRWLDYSVVADYGAGCRIGAERSLEIRKALEQNMNAAPKGPRAPKSRGSA